VPADLVEPVVKLTWFRMSNLSDGCLMDLMKNKMSAISYMYINGNMPICVNLVL